jgi:hypothetical protein
VGWIKGRGCFGRQLGQLVDNTNMSKLSTSEIEMCDCGETGCTFTKKEAQKFAESLLDFRVALISLTPYDKLTEWQQFIRDKMCWEQFPGVTDEEWEIVIQNNKKRGKSSSMEGQLMSQFSDILK